MKLRYGLHGRVLTVIGATLVVMLAVVALMLQRQAVMQREVLTLSQESLHSLVYDRLRDRGEAVSLQVAQSLVNPLYYFDLDAIGAMVRDVLRQPDVRYVIVHDAAGDIIHDGSEDIATYGQAMADPLAVDAMAATGMLVQARPDVLEVSMPIRIGDQRLGGVRIGYSLDSVAADEARAMQGMGERLGGIARRHSGWIALLMSALVLAWAVVGVLLQRGLVRPIRQLADAARQIESGRFDAVVPYSARGDEVGDLMRAFARMGDSIVRHDRDMRRMAYTDALTGLANRLAFRELLDRRLMQLQGAGQQM
ncbi:MAG TPA: HAMP domain-containing protein, partial [Luteimonas sp.]|nr:HAMP domain-containing protein [Luteimonas sp.]